MARPAIYRFPDLPHWRFEVEEVTRHYHTALGVDDEGREVGKGGGDPETMLEECKQWAREIDAKLGRDSSSPPSAH